MDRFLDRRLFLKLSGMSLALTVTGQGVALAREVASARRRTGHLPNPGPGTSPRAQTDVPTLVTIFLRGGADGMNIVVPTDVGDHATYMTYRPTIGVTTAAMSAAGTLLTDAAGADVKFGLNPRATALRDLWQQGYLGVLPDVGYDNASRSHFDSQQFYENGTPFQKFTPDGWANRHLATGVTGDPLLRAIAFDYQTPYAMVGDYPTLTFADLSNLAVSGNTQRNDRFLATQEVAYPMLANGPRAYDGAVAQAGSDLVRAIRSIQALEPLPATNPAADYPDMVSGSNRFAYFGTRLKDLAKLIKTNAFEVQIAEVDLGGWDTHQNQLTSGTNHPDLVEALSRGIKGFVDDLGDTYMRNVVILVYSEFGRTARENGSIGTDHGNATMAFAVGHPSRVNGRRIFHGPTGWHGLTDLRDGRDLKHSTDYRSLIGEAVSRHLGNTSPDIFPGFTPDPVGFFV